MTVEPIRKAGPDDAASMSEALTAAFYADPFYRWMLPDDDHRAKALREFFDLVVDVLAVHDDAWTTADGATGAALWVPYGHEAMSDEVADRFAAEVARLAGSYADRMLGCSSWRTSIIRLSRTSTCSLSACDRNLRAGVSAGP